MKRSFLILAAVAAVGAAQAQILSQTSFETAEGYAPGALLGQQGWDSELPANTNYTVSRLRPHTGNYSTHIDTDPLSGTNWIWQSLNKTPGVDVAPIIKASVWVNIGAPFQSTSSLTSSFGFGAYDFTGALVASLRIRSNGTVQTSTGTTVTTSATILRDTWYKLDMSMDYTTKMASFAVDGASFGSASFTPSTLGDVDLMATASGFDVGYYDDYKVEAVPEPATLTAMGLGLLALARRRRSK